MSRVKYFQIFVWFFWVEQISGYNFWNIWGCIYPCWALHKCLKMWKEMRTIDRYLLILMIDRYDTCIDWLIERNRPIQAWLTGRPRDCKLVNTNIFWHLISSGEVGEGGWYGGIGILKFNFYIFKPQNENL